MCFKLALQPLQYAFEDIGDIFSVIVADVQK